MHAEQNTDIRLARAAPDDAIELAQLASVIWPEAFAEMISGAQIEYMLKTIQSAPAMVRQMRDGMAYYFVLANEQRVGYAALQNVFASRTTKLSKLYILAQHRNGRISLAALEEVLRIAAKAGSSTLSLTVNRGNARAIRFYEKHGFARSREIVMDIGGGFVMDDYVMERPVEVATAGQA